MNSYTAYYGDGEGSYTKIEEIGFPNDDDYVCEKENRCLDGEYCTGEHQKCTTHVDQSGLPMPFCQCATGYKDNKVGLNVFSGISADGHECIDYNECDGHVYNCHESQECSNTVGSYNCVCKKGFLRNSNEASDNFPCIRCSGDRF